MEWKAELKRDRERIVREMGKVVIDSRNIKNHREL